MSDNGTRNGQSPVTLIAGEQASGLANIVGQYLEQLIGESPQKRSEADALRGNLGLLAWEGDVAITIVFSDDGIVIQEGLHGPDAVISGEVEALYLCGATQHPHGFITFAPAYNALQVIAEDQGLERWWQ